MLRWLAEKITSASPPGGTPLERTVRAEMSSDDEGTRIVMEVPLSTGQ